MKNRKLTRTLALLAVLFTVVAAASCYNQRVCPAYYDTVPHKTSTKAK